MSIKEKPLINAASNMGPMWSPSSPFFAGVWSVLLVSIFAVVLVFFQLSGRGAVRWAELMPAIFFGLIIGYLLVAVTISILWMQQDAGEADRETVLPFTIGAFGAMGAMLLLGAFFGESIYLWAESLPPFHGMAPH